MAFHTMDQEQGSVPEAHKSALVPKMFISALLLSGSEAGAERSILEAISTMGSGEVSGDALLAATLRTAVAPQEAIPRETSQTADLYTSGLPIELRRVLVLPEDPRRCFVLHILIGLPVGECSRLLSLNDCEIERNTVWAALELAALDGQANVPRCHQASDTRVDVVSDR